MMKSFKKESEERMQLMTVAEYAKHRGVSIRAVHNALESGRIEAKNPGGRPLKIEPIQADDDWKAFTDCSRVPMKFDGKVEGSEREFMIARAERMKWAAEKTRVAVLEKKGVLVDAKKAKELGFSMGRTTRDAILAIPDRIAAELCGISDEATINARLTKELNEALRELTPERIERSLSILIHSDRPKNK